MLCVYLMFRDMTLVSRMGNLSLAVLLHGIKWAPQTSLNLLYMASLESKPQLSAVKIV